MKTRNENPFNSVFNIELLTLKQKCTNLTIFDGAFHCYLYNTKVS